jgi:hypothetical protein
VVGRGRVTPDAKRDRRRKPASSDQNFPPADPKSQSFTCKQAPSHLYNPSSQTFPGIMAAKLEDASSDLYERCTNAALSSPEGRAKIFGQDELLKMGVVDSAQALLELLQGLMDAQLVRLMQMDGKICYALRTKDDATKCVFATSRLAFRS